MVFFSVSFFGLKYNEILYFCLVFRDFIVRILFLGFGKGWGREVDGGIELLNWFELSVILFLLVGGWYVVFCFISF